MSVFVYKAKKGPGVTVDGQIEADSRTVALARLDALGLSPISLELMTSPGRNGVSRRGRGRVSSRDITVFTRQLAGLLRAGVPILRALATIQQQSGKTSFRRLLDEMVGSVRDGRMLSETLQRFPALFPELYVNMVHAGESAGLLDEMLLRLGEAREHEDELRGKVMGAVAYPALVLTIGGASVFVILAFFLPRITQLFEGMHQALPLPTRVVMAVSGVFAAAWYWLLAAFVLGAFVLYRYVRSPRGRLTVDALVLRLPVVGRFALDTDLVRFSRTLALLLAAGIPIERALTLSAKTLLNRRLQESVCQVGDATVRRGTSLAEGFRQRPEIPVFLTNMMAVGEEGGRLDESLQEAASFYQRELDRDLRLMTTLLEPVLILVVGLAVGFIIFAMLLPIFQIGQGLR
jgi:type II secretory pathway component PulF